MSWLTEFRDAYESFPSQDNEGYVPNRGGFKAGFCSAWHKQQQRIDTLEFRIEKFKEAHEAMKRALEAIYAYGKTDTAVANSIEQALLLDEKTAMDVPRST